MTTSVEQIEQWLNAPSETENLEFKEAKQQYNNEKLYKYCIALANEGGGHLILGVSDTLPRRVVGTQAFNDPVAMSSKLFNAIGFRVEIEEIAHPDGRVLVFHIPPRPNGTAFALEGAYWMRVGQGLLPMQPDQLRRIFAEGKPHWLEQPAREGLSAQEVVDVLDTQSFFELLSLPYQSDRNGVLSRLEERHVIHNRKGAFSVSRLGALLLAKIWGVSRRSCTRLRA